MKEIMLIFEHKLILLASEIALDKEKLKIIYLLKLQTSQREIIR